MQQLLQEAVLRGRLIHSSNDVDMCRIAVLAGESVYSYDDLIYEFDADRKSVV